MHSLQIRSAPGRSKSVRYSLPKLTLLCRASTAAWAGSWPAAHLGVDLSGRLGQTDKDLALLLFIDLPVRGRWPDWN